MKPNQLPTDESSKLTKAPTIELPFFFKAATLHGTKRQRDRAGASIGSDQAIPSAKRESSILPRASLRAQDRSRGAPAQTQAQANKTLQTQDQPPKSKHPKAKPSDTPWHEAAAGSGRSKHRKRSNLPQRAARKLHSPPSFPASAGPIPRSPSPEAHQNIPIKCLHLITPE
jgi:hypothetical protein